MANGVRLSVRLSVCPYIRGLSLTASLAYIYAFRITQHKNPLVQKHCAADPKKATGPTSNRRFYATSRYKTDSDVRIPRMIRIRPGGVPISLRSQRSNCRLSVTPPADDLESIPSQRPSRKLNIAPPSWVGL